MNEINLKVDNLGHLISVSCNGSVANVFRYSEDEQKRILYMNVKDFLECILRENKQ